MPILLTLLSLDPSISIPQSWQGRLIAGLAWLGMLLAILVMLRRWRQYNRQLSKRYWLIFAVLALLTPITSLLIGVYTPEQWGPLPTNLPLETPPVIAVFAAIPWVLAAGLLGPAAAAILAAVAGVLQALWNTHSPFTPLEFALLGTMFGFAMHQRYRTTFYRLLSHPLIAAVCLAIVYPFLFFFTASVSTDGLLANRLDYALSLAGISTLVMAVELLVAGIFAEVVALGAPSAWGSRSSLQPAPSERSLQARFLQSIIPIILILLLSLLVTNWVLAGISARQILQERMGDAAMMASKGLPYFLIVGQNEIKQIAADDRLFTEQGDDLTAILSDDILRVPFFSQLYVLDSQGNSIGGYPETDYGISQPTLDEQEGIKLIQQGVDSQVFSIPPKIGGNAAQVAFIARTDNEDGSLKGIVVGRSELEGNLFTAPFLSSLQNIGEIGGQSLVLDDEKRILYHPNPAMLMSEYSGEMPDIAQAAFYEDIAPDGTRQLVYYQPIEGKPWAVVITVPARRVQEIALGIAGPLVVIILVLAIITIVVLRLRLNAITSSLQTLAVQSDNIARGQLDESLNGSGEDEIGQLRRSFEQMRVSLKLRLEELNQLLVVVQGVASNLEMNQAVQPVLDAVINSGASAARVVLDQSMVPELEGEARAPVAYSAGARGEAYSYLDDQILALTRLQDRLVLNNVVRPRLLRFNADEPRPESVMGVSLRHEGQFYGALWLAYDEAHTFSEEEVRFLITVAGEAALAAANARLFLNAEIGRQRLSAILASTPDPVLVTDQQNRLLLANPAVWRVLGMGGEWDEGKPMEEVISQKELLELLDKKAQDKRSVEITMPDQRVYYATATSVIAEGHRVGRVCVLRDITSFKELDALKSEFVNTVSHDLRSPLTLVRGYASMLEIVGDLNEQQNAYLRKMISSADDMTRLVSDILDLGRIEAGIGLKIVRVPVREIVDHVMNALQLQAAQRKVQLTAEISPQAIPWIEADQALLQQALYNLVDNGIKNTEANGMVKIRVEPRQDMTQFMVSDTGVGISTLDQPRIFEKFFRSSSSSSKKQQGTGLGLAIVKSIAERHGGTVTVYSILGKGSTFTLVIPTTRAALTGEQASPVSAS